MIADPGMMPDLSHLSSEERAIIEQVFQRQKEEEQKEEEIAQKADEELDAIERVINDRKENAKRLVGTQNDAICQICQKTKFADGIGHKCFHCELRSCARCGGRTQHKNKSIWACSTCQKRQELFARSGKWFKDKQPTSGISPSGSQSGDPAESMEMQAEIEQPNGGPPMQEHPHARRQGSIHRQPSLETEMPQKMNGSVHTGTHHHAAAVAAPAATTSIPNHHPQPPAAAATNHQPPPAHHPTATTTAHRQNGPTTAVHSNGATPATRRPSATAAAAKSRTADAPRNGPVDYAGAQRATTSATAAAAAPTSSQQQRPPSATSATRSRVQRNEPIRTTGRHAAAPATVQAAKEPRIPAVPEGTSIDYRQSGPTALHGTGRMRRGRLSRQIRSLSSSEDDEGLLGGAARRHSHIEPDFSEKDLLKYIYGNHRFTKASSHNAVGELHSATAHSSLPGSRAAFYDAAVSTSTPHLNYAAAVAATASSTLASKIRHFLQQPVSWQPSADQRRLIGHIVLQRPETDNGDLGLKVIGGRHSSSGRLGAFITQVRAGSVADIVGQLRAGDEVLEWNGDILQNLTNDGVYQVISAAKNSPKVELIVSRAAAAAANDDFGPMPGAATAPRRQMPSVHTSPVAHSDYGASVSQSLPYAADHYRIPHSKSLVNPRMAYYLHEDSRMSPIIHKPVSPNCRGQVLGKLEFSLLYLNHEHELLITIYQAVDLPPRANGSARNPYVKIFLLPDRSEESRRQSKVIYETLNPAWNECFFYYALTAPDLAKRVLEITVWDYDQYNGHDFLGETVIDLSDILLDNQHFSYPLVDMDDENPIRLRLRQSRIHSPYGYHDRLRSQSAACDDYRYYDPAAYSAREYAEPPSHRSRYDEMDWSNGYQSDHGYSRAPPNPYYRRPRSATGFRHIADFESRATAYRNQPITEESFDDPRGPPSVPADPSRAHERYERYARDYGPTAPPMDNGGGGPRPPPHGNERSHRAAAAIDPRTIADGAEFMNQRQRELIMEQSSAGYGSDGSETLSANSAQSMQKRAANRNADEESLNLQDIPTYSPRHHFYENPANSVYPTERGQNGGGAAGRGGYGAPQRRPMEEMGYKLNGQSDEVPQRMNGMDMSAAASAAAAAREALSMKERKKSLMTRLIPGRNAPADGKRTGFARSEEVGIPDALGFNGAPAGNEPALTVPFLKQSSKDSTDSSHSDNFQPVLADGTLGQFVENLGPGQVVGRQALGSPTLGEIQLGLYVQDGCLFVDVKRAKNLTIRPGSKINPAPYVKVYLMHNKQCISKAKTQTVRKTTAPIFSQKLSFAESYKHRMLQVTVLGDYGRMERKGFMGIAQIRLDDLPLSSCQPIDGWYKLFHSASLTGTGAPAGPVRKDSENSLMEM